MPAYVTVQDVVGFVRADVLLHLIDDEGTGILDLETPGAQLTRVQQAITNACDEADTYFAVRYDLPFTTVPVVVRAKVLDVAVWNLWGRRGVRQDTADETVQQRYQDAVRWLQRVADGKAALPVPPAPDGSTEPPATDAQAAIVTRPRRGWSRR